MGSELDEFIGRVNERTDIHSVVSRYVSLKQKNGRYWGLCPFHSEKTASFSVSPDKGLFYCFGCNVGGNAFKFLSLIENISYLEAVKLQAQRLGIDLPEKNHSPEEERRRREEKILLKINESAQDFYHECLTKAARDSVGRKYLEARGITAKTIETFKLGYAPDEWATLLTHLTRQGFSPQLAETVGLVTKRKSSTGCYDRFRGRIMIPIADVFGHVVGFGGRILTDTSDNNPKYLNTPETALFNKGKLLFGLDKSNRAISVAGTAIVVEGYMDAISLFSAGITNVVATLGTAFTPEHAKLILRYARKIIFCYDSDEAGQRATIRALPMVQATGAEVFVIKVPDGKDPDEFIRKHGKGAFDALLQKAESLIDYRMNYVLGRADLMTIEGRVKALKDILPVTVKVSNEVTCNEYRRKLSYALSLDEQIVINEWKKFAANERRPVRQEPARKSSIVKKQSLKISPLMKSASENILRMLWHESDLLSYVTSLLPREIFLGVYREIFGWMEVCAAEEKPVDKLSAARELSEEANAELSRILIDGDDEPRNTEINLFHDSVAALRQIVLKKEYRELYTKADVCDSNDRATYVQTVQESFKVKNKIDELQSN